MIEQVLLFTLVSSFLIAVLSSPFFIPFLRRLKFGQSIRDEGPKSHQKKQGTPTMGGIVIVLALVVATYAMTAKFFTITAETHLLLLVTLGYGLIGFLDDFIKVVRKRNLGLTSKQKLVGQLIIAALFYFGLKMIDFTTAVSVPGTDFSFDLGWFYPVFVLIMLIGASNAVNLTDGLDGLLAGTAAIAFGAFAVLASTMLQFEAAIFCVAVVGAVLGFLVFNAHPAKVFMGDTGSLALGGAISAVAILTKMEILLVIIGGVFVIETLSVMIQVTSLSLLVKGYLR